MNVLPHAARRCAVALLLVPLACGADGVLRGELPTARASADAPGVQVTALPSGAWMKRLPGQTLPGDAAGARASPLPAGVSVQQAGGGQMLVLGGQPGAAASARPPGLTARQSGGVMLLEMPGQRQATERSSAAPATPVLPAGGRIVDLAPNEALPVNPQPNTLYRRLN